LISPIEINDRLALKYAGKKDLSLRFPNMYEKIARKYDCLFINSQQYIQPSNKDGVHLEPESHKILGQLIAEKIKEFSL
jgi:lysophospholipase L1-like esterase